MTILLLDPYFKIKGWIYRGILGVLVKNSLNLILFPQNIKFYSPRVGRIEQNEIRFNDFITKTPKCPIHLALYFKIGVY